MCVPTFADQYTGIPYEEGGRTRYGCDCWGLCRLIYLDQYGIDLDEEAIEIQHIGGHWQEVDEPVEGDVLLFKTGNTRRHVGIALDNTWMLHCDTEMDSVRERFNGLRWHSRLQRIYRYVKAH